MWMYETVEDNRNMDKSWIDSTERLSSAYFRGVEEFLKFAYTDQAEDATIYCPCRLCLNRYFVKREVVREHLIINGFSRKYKNWTKHGEAYVSRHGNQENETLDDSNIGDDIIGMIHEAIGVQNVDVSVENLELPTNDPRRGTNEPTAKLFKLLQDAERELYPGCEKFTTLSFLVRLLHIKALCGWTDKSITMLLVLLNEAFPIGVKLASSYYEAKKVIDDLGFTYKTWDACPNSCMLFRNEEEKMDKCSICNTSRWKQHEGDTNDAFNGSKPIAAKQVRYFPLKPRLQRLFMSSKTASHMRWHLEGRTDDGVFRHPADSLAWKTFDKRYPIFASDSRNVRLGLASDGFNPFRSMNIVHSTWPVVLMPYNLPPWMCMKQPFFILSVLIDGPKGPGNKIDVYLQPLIEELKELWEDGVQTFDASSGNMFQLHAALLWTINDFPAYANLSGWSTKGEYACPICNTNT